MCEQQAIATYIATLSPDKALELIAEVRRLRRVADALTVLVNNEYPEGKSLAEIATTWGAEVLTKEQQDALATPSGDAPREEAEQHDG